MVGESNKNVFFIQKDASNFAEFEISKFEISRFDYTMKPYTLGSNTSHSDCNVKFYGTACPSCHPNSTFIVSEKPPFPHLGIAPCRCPNRGSSAKPHGNEPLPHNTCDLPQMLLSSRSDRLFEIAGVTQKPMTGDLIEKRGC